MGLPREARWILTFDPALQDDGVVETLRGIVETVRAGYGTEVDIEFTANITREGVYKVDIVQCRPFAATTSVEDPVAELPQVPEDRIVLRSAGGVIGQGRRVVIERIVYVSPQGYTNLSEERRYALARLIGRIAARSETSEGALVLIGPGRWGSSTPSLGIPVSFSEINAASVVVEVDSLHEGLIPDLSLGTHFFNDLVEMNTLYVAHFLAQPRNRLDWDFFAAQPSSLSSLVAEAGQWDDVVRVIEPRPGRELTLHADALSQTCLIYTSP